MSGVLVKENVYRGGGVSTWWACVGMAALAGALALAGLADTSLPALRKRGHTPKHEFIAEIAHEHLVNLTLIGPRVAGSYENEVLAVRILVEALRRIKQDASPHNRVEIDVLKASGGFSLSFFDGMNNIYRDVQSVVARVSGAGETGGGKTAVLINCHYDTVPDSPGASDDGAGCAVAMETFRALSASPTPLRHPVILLLNGAEENIMQGSHAFVTSHPWARSVRAFVNLEACGAGGREVLFQAGPHDPWIMEVYAATVPHPFASSVAQEMFQSGLIPGDTDYRIFRDFGNLSGVDLAWSSNGYVYHTARDVHAGVAPRVLQRTGDNVLALVKGMLESPEILEPVDPSSRPGVFFDVAGLVTVSCRVRCFALVCAALLALQALAARPSTVHMSRSAWLSLLARLTLLLLCAGAAGTLAGGVCGAALSAAGRALPYYRRVWLLAPLYAAPGLCVSWCVVVVGARRLRVRTLGTWGAARACAVCVSGAWGVLAALCALRGLGSGSLPALHAAPALALSPRYTHERTALLLWWVLSVVPCVQTCYLAWSTLGMLVPIAARAGTPPLHIDVVIGALTSGLTLCASCALLPLVLLVRRPARLMWCCLFAFAVGLLFASLDPSPFSAQAPRRLMMFHVRKTMHEGVGVEGKVGRMGGSELMYWIPEITPADLTPLEKYMPLLRARRDSTTDECHSLPYCGAPYYLPVQGFVSRGAWMPASTEPLPKLDVALAIYKVNDTTQELRINYTGPSHVVIIVSPWLGARVTLVRHAGGALRVRTARVWFPHGRDTYFLALHDANSTPRRNELTVMIEHSFTSPPPRWADVSASGHALSGPLQRSPQHEALLKKLPDSVAATGWGVDMHFYHV